MYLRKLFLFYFLIKDKSKRKTLCHQLLLWLNTSQNELHLASNGSKSYLISGSDSSYSWVFIRALGLWEARSCWL